jgi:hypothetical protein
LNHRGDEYKVGKFSAIVTIRRESQYGLSRCCPLLRPMQTVIRPHFRMARDFGASIFVSVSPRDFTVNSLICVAQIPMERSHALRHSRTVTHGVNLDVEYVPLLFNVSSLAR